MFARTCVNTRRSLEQPCSSVLTRLHVRKTSLKSTFGFLNADKTRGETHGTCEPRSPGVRLSKTQYRLIEDVEDLDRYRPGGYHPLKIGDDLNDGRYRLVDKLGYGGSSTIWLARDLQMARYVAVKVIIADASVDAPEAILLSSLARSPSRPGSETIPSIIEQFWAVGPNGKHKCIVTPSARMSLFDAKEASKFGLFRPKVAQSIIAQLIREVDFLHSEHIVHGDLHLGNILVHFPKVIDHFPTSELYKEFGEPKSEAVICVDGKPLSTGVPTNVYVPGWFGARSDELALGEEKIILSDFGESFNPHKTRRFSSNTLPLLQPPEARFSDKPLSFASDIWTLACTIWEIFGQRPLFEAFYPTADRVTAEQVEVLGILPPEWWQKWNGRLEWFDEQGELDPKSEASRGHDRIRMTWDKRFGYCIQEPRAEAGLETASEEEKKSFRDDASIDANVPAERKSDSTAGIELRMDERMGEPALEESRRTMLHINPVMKGN